MVYLIRRFGHHEKQTYYDIEISGEVVWGINNST
jgi:hypothetical protein